MLGSKLSLKFIVINSGLHRAGSTWATYIVLLSKIQQTKMLVTCQRFGDLFLFGLIWQYYSNHKTYNKGRFKVIATYLQQ